MIVFFYYIFINNNNFKKNLEKRKRSVRKQRIQKGTKLFEFIQEKLYQYWSPEIIALKWNEQHKDDSISVNLTQEEATNLYKILYKIIIY